MFVHVARCPVCRTELDQITTPGVELDGMAAAMLLNDTRQAHGKASPNCTRHRDWVKGWTIDEPVKKHS